MTSLRLLLGAKNEELTSADNDNVICFAHDGVGVCLLAVNSERLTASLTNERDSENILLYMQMAQNNYNHSSARAVTPYL